MNGFISHSFQPSKGLRVGDSLSPYLFIFDFDVLSCMLQDDLESSRLVGVRVVM